MAQPKGYVLNVAKERRAAFRNAMDEGDPLAEAVPEFSHSRNLPLVAFVGFQNKAVTHIASARRGMRAGTQLRRLNLQDIFKLPKPLRHSEIVKRLEMRFSRRASLYFSQGGLMPPATFTAVVDAVRDLSPESRPVLDRFSQVRRSRIARLPERAKKALAYQKEAVATALSLAGLDRHLLQDWQPPVDETPTSFLDGLSSARGMEDSVVVHDMATVPGFRLARRLPVGAAVFQGETVRLTVVLANKLPLEKQLGADLIYFNETYKAFVVVQYKMMEKIRSKTTDEVVFRLPDAQLDAELNRMEGALKMLRKCKSNTERNGFRLTENPFFLKFCSRLLFNPDDAGLVPGMYIPLDYWRLIEADKTLVGPRGGHQLTFKNVGRYLDNTDFIRLMADAWVGTTVQQSAVLQVIVRNVLESGRAVTLAFKTENSPPEPAGDGYVYDAPPEIDAKSARVHVRR